MNDLRIDRARTWRSRLAKATLAIAGATALVVGVALPAEARSWGTWAWSHNAGQTFLAVTLGDDNTYMTRARVQHMHAVDFYTTYCGAQARVNGTLSTGKAWSQTFGYERGCNFVMVDETMAPKKYFKGGSKFYGQAYHDGAWSPGKPYIHP